MVHNFKNKLYDKEIVDDAAKDLNSIIRINHTLSMPFSLVCTRNRSMLNHISAIGFPLNEDVGFLKRCLLDGTDVMFFSSSCMLAT
jgi:hypothetical protein